MEMEKAFQFHDDFLRQVWRNAPLYVREVLENDEKVDCVVCQKPISGPAFVHYGYTYLNCHFSCLNAPTNYKALLFHFGFGHRRLIFTEEVKSDGKEDVLCLGCEKPVLGPRYKCSTSDCNLLLHQSCVELSPQIQQHPFRPNHTLVLVEPEEKKYCNVCGKNCSRYPFYHCSECDFNLDITCAATRPRNINTDDCQHAFIPFFQKNKFTCNSCGEEAKELASQCSICQLLIHGKCARFPCIISISRHNHSLALTYSLGQVKEHLANSVFCRFCYQRVKTEYAAYYCQECNYVAHLDCAFEDGESEELLFLPKKSVDLVTDVMEVEGAGQIKHFSHQHDLILGNEELVDVKFCDGCMEFIFAPFYCCTRCNFFLHNRCARLPRKMNHILHQHQLTLVSQVPYPNGLFLCDACRNDRHGFAYRCDMCNFDLDLQCSETQIQHFSHQHDLILGNEELTDVKFCDGSMEFISTPFYSCTRCNFFLHSRCARLPSKKNHILHQHQLTLVSQVPYNNGLFVCDACSNCRHGFAYRCDLCHFDLDLQCCSISETMKHKGHQHSLFLPVKSNRRCHACDRPSDKEPRVHKFVFVCTSCDFALGLECAILPLVAWKCKYDDHLLNLTYIAEDHCEEYYCLICGKKRDPNHWFYYCAECDFPAHPQCVLGKYPYIKFGSTLRDEDIHQHPLTFVSKTESSPPCDACGRTFDDLAVECTQCKSNVHFDYSCIDKITDEVVPE